VELAGRWADEFVEAGLHVHVDVFEFVTPRESASLNLIANGSQPLDDTPSIFIVYDVLTGEHPRMSDGTGNVLPVEAPVIV
jgi:hypothetical protein